MKRIQNKYLYITCLGFIIAIFGSCSDFLNVDDPKSKIESSLVFSNDVTAEAAVLGMYSQLVSNQSFASGDQCSVSSLAGLSSDELINVPETDLYSLEFEANSVASINGYVYKLWSSLYSPIYQANAIIEGLNSSTGVSLSVKNQLLGEAFFVRAFCNFYLVNVFGDAPIVATTDYVLNSSITKSSSDDIYSVIVSDLEVCRDLLSVEYSAEFEERIRPNRYAACALLARVYLYTGNWEKAEVMSTEVINASSLYDFSDLNSVFLMNSREAIWQLRPITSIGNLGATAEARIYSPSMVAYYNVLNEGIVDAFEANDMRLQSWVDTLFVGGDTLFFPTKYRQGDSSLPISEYSMVLRLSEQYLIRAEARAMLNVLTGLNSAQADVNMIRARVGLEPVSSASLDGLLADILRERRLELFSEWGHRWFDLKRSGNAEAVLSKEKINFSTDDLLYPIPALEITRNPNLNIQPPIK